MEVITSDFDLDSISGGRKPADNIKCTIGTSGANCAGSLSDFVGTLNDFGAWLGGQLYDWTH